MFLEAGFQAYTSPKTGLQEVDMKELEQKAVGMPEEELEYEKLEDELELEYEYVHHS